MESILLQEAFKQLEGLGALTEADINITSPDDELNDFLKSYDVDPDEEILETDIEIIDPEAETEDGLEGAYTGKVILDCCVCHSKIYKDPSEVEVDEEGNVVNLDEECPYCYSTDGYKVIGQVEDVDIHDLGNEDSINLGDVLDDGEDTVSDSIDTDDLEEDICRSKRYQKPEGLTKVPNTSENIYDKIKAAGILDEDTKLDETLAGTVLGAAAGAAVGHPVVGAAAGSAISNALKKDESLDEAVPAAIVTGAKFIGTHWKDILAGLEAVGVAKDTIEDIYRKIKSLDLSLTEELQSATLETDSDIINVNNSGGSLNISTSSKEDSVSNGEVIAPVSDEIRDLIESNSDEDMEEGDFTDIDIDDVDENSLDDVTESYLKEAYNNVRAYKTSKISEKNGKLFVEGIITFKSGNLRATEFIYEAYNTNGKGKIKLVGKNANICEGKGFVVNGKMKGSQMITESLSYNYIAKNSKKNVSGIVKR